MTDQKIPTIGLSADQQRKINEAIAGVLKATGDAFAKMGRDLRMGPIVRLGSHPETLAKDLEALSDEDLKAVRFAADHLDDGARHEQERRQMEREKTS